MIKITKIITSPRKRKARINKHITQWNKENKKRQNLENNLLFKEAKRKAKPGY